MSFFHRYDRNVRGLRYRIRAHGPDAGPTVFLLHGLLDNGAGFEPLARALPEGWRLVAPDWRGHGDSEAAPGGYWFPDYVADLDALVRQESEREPITLIGHSMGGQAASLYAGLRPDRVRHLICLDSLQVPATSPEHLRERYRAWLDAESEPPAPRRYDSLEALAERIGRRYPELAEGAVAWLADIWSRPDGDGVRLAVDPRHFLPFPIAFHPEEAMAVWSRVEAPVLCLDGGASPAREWLSAEARSRRRDAFADCTERSVPDAGHMLHMQCPAETAAAITAFVGEL